MKKIYFIIFLIFLSACSEDKRVENDNDLLQITFATDWKAQAEQGGFYQALASGKYLEKGLNVKIIQGSANINIPRLLASNSIDFGMGSNSFIPMNMVANNIPGKAVMAVFQKDPQIIMTHGDNNINSIDDIKGLPITLQRLQELIVYILLLQLIYFLLNLILIQILLYLVVLVKVLQPFQVEQNLLILHFMMDLYIIAIVM